GLSLSCYVGNPMQGSTSDHCARAASGAWPGASLDFGGAEVRPAGEASMLRKILFAIKLLWPATCSAQTRTRQAAPAMFSPLVLAGPIVASLQLCSKAVQEGMTKKNKPRSKISMISAMTLIISCMCNALALAQNHIVSCTNSSSDTALI